MRDSSEHRQGSARGLQCGPDVISLSVSPRSTVDPIDAKQHATVLPLMTAPGVGPIAAMGAVAAFVSSLRLDDPPH